MRAETSAYSTRFPLSASTSPLGARSGSAYLAGLRDGRAIRLDAVNVADVTEDARLARSAQSIAALYDLQRRPDLQSSMLFASPSSGMPVGLAFLQPTNTSDLVRRRAAFETWADFSGGMLGRAPDFMSALISGLAAASDYFGVKERQFGENLARYHEHCREHDLCLTHALSRPVTDRAQAIHMVREEGQGIVVSGSRALATLAPFADEILIFPGPSPKQLVKDRDEDYALAFCVPVATPGLTFLCRQSLDFGQSAADHPLSVNFDEQDAVALFDHVRVPWERVFLYRDVERANDLWTQTQAFYHGVHQFLVKNTAKAEFMFGVTSLAAEAMGTDRHQHVQAMLGEIVDAIETLRAFIRAAEVDAVRGPGGTVVPNPEVAETARSYFPAVYPRLVEILQIIGASGHLVHVPAAIAESDVADVVEMHYRTGAVGGHERVRLFKLAWDAACSGFAGRQLLYERYFDGDPFRKRSARYTGYAGKDEAQQRVRAFMARSMRER
jgi:4-hydroxyphenylacetate 3-monooxygenase